ncbi:MAG: U-box domain-containing protein [Parashewanella sp.]
MMSVSVTIPQLSLSTIEAELSIVDKYENQPFYLTFHGEQGEKEFRIERLSTDRIHSECALQVSQLGRESYFEGFFRQFLTPTTTLAPRSLMAPAKNTLSSNDAISAAQAYNYLLQFNCDSMCPRLLSIALGLSVSTIFNLNINNSLQGKQGLHRILMATTNLTIRKVIGALHDNASFRKLRLIEQINAWMMNKGISETENLHGTQYVDELCTLLNPIAPQATILAQRLTRNNIYACDAVEVAQHGDMMKVLERATCENKLTVGNFISALVIAEKTFAAHNLSTRLKISSEDLFAEPSCELIYSKLFEEYQRTGEWNVQLCFQLLKNDASHPAVSLMFCHYKTKDESDNAKERLAKYLVDAIQSQCFNIAHIVTLSRYIESSIHEPDLSAYPELRPPPLLESKRLSPVDLACFLQPYSLSISVFILLGMQPKVSWKLSPIRSSCKPTMEQQNAMSAEVWEAILTHWPTLETCHLAAMLIGNYKPFSCVLLSDTSKPRWSAELIEGSVPQRVELVTELIENPDWATFLYQRLEVEKELRKQSYDTVYFACLSTPYQILLVLNHRKDPFKRVEMLKDEHKQSIKDQIPTLELTQQQFDERFRCPITWGLLEKPIKVASSNGVVNYFSREALLRHLQAQRTNPINRDPLLPERVELLPINHDVVTEMKCWINYQISRGAELDKEYTEWLKSQE